MFVVDALLCALLVGGARFGERAFVGLVAGLARRSDQRRVLIVGAGKSGRSLLRELRETPNERVVGFLDDDPQLRGRRIHGVRIVGLSSAAPEAIARTHANAVVVTIPSAPAERLSALVDACEQAGVPLQFVHRQISETPPALVEAQSR